MPPPVPIPTPAERLQKLREQSKHIKRAPKGCVKVMSSSGQKVLRTDEAPPLEEKPKRKRPAKPRARADERHIAAAKELRARFLEQFNRHAVVEGGKYDPTRSLDAAPSAFAALGRDRADKPAAQLADDGGDSGAAP